MNIGMYSLRDDEADYVEQMQQQFNIHILTTSEDSSVDNTDFLEGCEGVSVLGQVYIGRELLNMSYLWNNRYTSMQNICTAVASALSSKSKSGLCPGAAV